MLVEKCNGKCKATYLFKSIKQQQGATGETEPCEDEQRKELEPEVQMEALPSGGRRVEGWTGMCPMEAGGETGQWSADHR